MMLDNRTYDYFCSGQETDITPNNLPEIISFTTKNRAKKRDDLNKPSLILFPIN